MRSSGMGAERAGRVRAIVLCAILAAGLPAGARAQSSGGPAGDETSDDAAFRVSAERHRGYAAVGLSELGGEILRDVSLRGSQLRVRLGDVDLELRGGSPFYRADDRTGQLSNPPYRAEGEFWIPAELFLRGLPELGVLPSLPGDAELARLEDGEATLAIRPADREPRGPWRVVIDAGHGGRDPGARGPDGTREKSVTLAIALHLRDRLASVPGLEVTLTRDDDTFVPLAERSRMAVSEQANLFISIHANANPARSARGFETYFLSQARSEEAREVALRENRSIRFEDEEDRPEMSDVQHILTGNMRNMNVRESSHFAGRMQNELRGVLGIPDRGVKQAPFYVLVGASGSMPAVLAEVGFLSNPSDERLLRSEQGQEGIAEALSQAVTAYRNEYESRLYADRAPDSG